MGGRGEAESADLPAKRLKTGVRQGKVGGWKRRAGEDEKVGGRSGLKPVE
jgi:hypothetical protein